MGSDRAVGGLTLATDIFFSPVLSLFSACMPSRGFASVRGIRRKKRGHQMPFKQTNSHGKPVRGSPDGSVLARELDELNKVCERIEQEKTYINRAESEVSSIAERVKTEALSVPDGLKQAVDVEQNLETNMKKIKKRAFTVFAKDEEGHRYQYPDPSVKVFDILIHTEDLLVSEEKANFKVDIDRTMMVIDQVLKPKGYRSNTMMVINQILKPEGSSSKGTLDWNSHRRAKYFRGLVGICRVGLEHEDPSQLTLAKKSLESFREEFVANEAGSVKNGYLWRLGLRCLAMSVVASLAYVYARSLDNTHTVHYFRNFFLLVAGAGVGTWLSFALRRVIVTFLDLAALEEDRLDPGVRVLFITALTSIVGLLIWTGAVSLGIGQFITTEFYKNGTTALLIGLLLGVAERTMATAVEKRATEFGAGIGGK
jgi:hypothetical protein